MSESDGDILQHIRGLVQRPATFDRCAPSGGHLEEQLDQCCVVTITRRRGSWFRGSHLNQRVLS